MKYEYQFCCSAFCGFRFLDCGIFVRASFDQQKTWDRKTLSIISHALLIFNIFQNNLKRVRI